MTLVVVEAAAGDVDVDGDVELVDFNAFQACLQGPTSGTAVGCICSDVDQSGSVDLRDFAITQGAFSGPIP